MTRRKCSCVGQIETPLDAGIDTIQLTRQAQVSILKCTDRPLQFAHSVKRTADMKKMLEDFIAGLGHMVGISQRRSQDDHDQVEP